MRLAVVLLSVCRSRSKGTNNTCCQIFFTTYIILIGLIPIMIMWDSNSVVSTVYIVFCGIFKLIPLGK